MKKLLLLASALLIAGAARAEPAPAEFSKGWCAGYAQAYADQQMKYGNWRTMLSIGRSPDADKTEAGQAAKTVMDSVLIYVLFPPASGARLTDGKTITCEQPAEPAKPAAPAAKKK